MRYLLLGATRSKALKFNQPVEPETINPLFVGSAEEVIAAACAAPCGVLLIDLAEVPTVKSIEGKCKRTA